MQGEILDGRVGEMRRSLDHAAAGITRRADGAVEHGAFRLATTIGGDARSGTRDGFGWRWVSLGAPDRSLFEEANQLRLVDRADGNLERAQHALLKIMEGAPVRLKDGRHIDTTQILFICGGAFVGLDSIMTKTHTFGFISTSGEDDHNILDRLNSRIKPTDFAAQRTD